MPKGDKRQVLHVIGRDEVAAFEEGAGLGGAEERERTARAGAEVDSFVLPGGGETAARLHVARTICRRVEREALVAANAHAVNQLVLVYLNRLSDLLFILARAANAGESHEEPLWRPGSSS